ncbi:tetratricopeptide repeat protein [Chryseobacterium sp. TY4]
MKKLVFLFCVNIFFFITCKGQEKQDYFEEGKLEMANQNFPEAISLFSKSIENKTQVSESYFARGLCRNLTKDYKNAVSDFNNSEKLGNNDVKLYTLRGFALNQIEKNAEALEDLNKAISINPDFYIKNFYNRGALEVRLNKLDDALKDFDIYIEQTNDPIAYLERGKVQYYLDNHKKACSDFEYAFSNGIKNEEVLKLKNKICN